MKRYLMTIGVVAVAALVFGTACEKAQMEPEKVGLPTTEPPADALAEDPPELGATAPGTVATIALGNAGFSVEIAESDEERAHGLQGRESLAPRSGMWFIFPETVQDEFWMKDTLVPLDIVFVGEDMKVVHIIENAVPGSTELLSSPVAYRYVLEIPAGSAEEYDIKVGDVAEKRIGPR